MASSGVKRKAVEASISSSQESKKPKSNASITTFFGAPKVKAGTASTATANFDKDKWAAGLTADQRELLKLEIETLHPSWLAHLKEDLVSNEFLELKRFLKREKESGKTVLPPPEDIYSWSRLTPLPTVKAVILGQDPYHNLRQAHGLCFSVRPPTPAPPSLKNMYIALRNDFPGPGGFKPPPNNGGLLTPWAERGVLLLNTCLTVRVHEANSHANKGWERLTGRVIEIVDRQRRGGVVFMAWGSPAGKRVAKVDQVRHNVLRSVHPSPLSAHKGFLDCHHFKLANQWLKERYGEDGPIDWNLGTTTKSPGSIVTVKPTSPTIAEKEDAAITSTSEIQTVKQAEEDKIVKKQETIISTDEVKSDGLSLEESLLAEAEAQEW